MHVYIIDWGGTLDKLPDPLAYVKGLQALGHKVVVYSGWLPRGEPAVEAADRAVSKFTQLRDLVNECRDDWPETQTIYYSDDDPVVRPSEQEVLEWVGVEFIYPRDLETHL